MRPAHVRAAYVAPQYNANLPSQRELANTLYRLGGVVTAVSFSSAFWVLALVLATNAAGVMIGAPVLTAFGLAVAAFCLIGLTAIMADRR